MGGGLLLVVAGLVWRGRSRPAPVAAPVPTATAGDPPELIGDEDLAAVPDEAASDGAASDVAASDVAATDVAANVAKSGATNVETNVAPNAGAEEPQSEAVARSDDADATTSDGAADADVASEAPSSSRTTRAPSPARRSAKRS